MEHTGKALVIRECAVFGRREKLVRHVKTDPPAPEAQFSVTVRVTYQEPRKRTPWSFVISPDNNEYVLIEVDGKIVYDSRTEVPCDMDKWRETRKRFES